MKERKDRADAIIRKAKSVAARSGNKKFFELLNAEKEKLAKGTGKVLAMKDLVHNEFRAGFENCESEDDFDAALKAVGEAMAKVAPGLMKNVNLGDVEYNDKYEGEDPSASIAEAENSKDVMAVLELNKKVADCMLDVMKNCAINFAEGNYPVKAVQAFKNIDKEELPVLEPGTKVIGSLLVGLGFVTHIFKEYTDSRTQNQQNNKEKTGQTYTAGTTKTDKDKAGALELNLKYTVETEVADDEKYKQTVDLKIGAQLYKRKDGLNAINIHRISGDPFEYAKEYKKLLNETDLGSCVIDEEVEEEENLDSYFDNKRTGFFKG
eukprot:UN30257